MLPGAAPSAAMDWATALASGVRPARAAALASGVAARGALASTANAALGLMARA